MAVRYSRLPTEETHVMMDYSSPFTYDTTGGTSNLLSEERHFQQNFKSAFTYEGWNPQQIAEDARYATVRQSLPSRICHFVVIGLAILILLLTFPITIWFCFKKVSNFEKIVIFRLGRLEGVKGPGLVFIIPGVDWCQKVDLRLKAFSVPPQQLITADRAVIEVGADIHYQVSDVKKSVTCIQDMNKSLRVLLRASLTNHLIRRDVSDIEEDKFKIMVNVQDNSNTTARLWGVEITRVELSPIKIIKAPERPEGGIPGLPAGLPQTFQQLTAAFMQAAAGQGDQSPVDGADGDTTELTTDNISILPVAEDAVGSENVITENVLSPIEVLSLAKGMLNESMVKSIQAIYLFKLKGESGGLFYLDLLNGSGSTGEGLPPGGEPTTTLTISVSDMQRMFLGKLKPMSAYMSGRLKVSGDLSAALKLEDIVKIVSDKMKLTNR